jgi:hypothetical protein
LPPAVLTENGSLAKIDVDPQAHVFRVPLIQRWSTIEKVVDAGAVITLIPGDFITGLDRVQNA